MDRVRRANAESLRAAQFLANPPLDISRTSGLDIGAAEGRDGVIAEMAPVGSAPGPDRAAVSV